MGLAFHFKILGLAFDFRILGLAFDFKILGLDFEFKILGLGSGNVKALGLDSTWLHQGLGT